MISLCESWAEHIGLTFANQTYGVNTSSVNFLQRLETTRNEEPDHIPIGFYHDLMDNIPDSVPACDENGGGCGMITDAASGFTNSQMFSKLTSATLSPLFFKTFLLQGTSITTQTQVNNLFNSY